MLFIYPMWDSEAERLGLQKCCRLSYTLRTIAEIGGAIGLYYLFFVIIYLLYKIFIGIFEINDLFILIYPFILAFICEIIFKTSYVIANKKLYKFNVKTGITTWIENGKEESYSFKKSKIF